MKDIIYVANLKHLKKTGNCLCVRDFVTKEQQLVSFDDIMTLIVDNVKCTFTSDLIMALSYREIPIIFCDHRHSPISELLPTNTNYRKYSVLQAQIDLSGRTKQRIWKKIVQCKITNQLTVLQACCPHQTDAIERLMNLSKSVEDNDRTNLEAQAARFYFPAMFGPDFKRGRYKDVTNSALNYGYAVIRSIIRRELVAHGFENSLGIWHASSENPFNLTEDLIEPYRPVIDRIVYNNLISKSVDCFEQEQKMTIVGVLLENMLIDERVFSLQNNISYFVVSLLQNVMNGTEKNFKVPTVIK